MAIETAGMTMPSRTTSAIKPPEPVAVTGANGFVAQHCIALLLKEGYRVVGTVRTAKKAKVVENTHGSHPSLAVLVIPDITSSTSYLTHLQDLRPSAILHLASPFSYDVVDYERDLMIPAVKGSIALLEAASQIPSVRRVIHTSSFACIFDPSLGPAPGRTYTSRDWSPLTYEDGVGAPDAPSAYRASKAAAEKAAWAYMQRARPGFDLVGLCPGMVFGPWLKGSIPSTLADLNTSNMLVWRVVSAGAQVPPTRGPVWVDVRDVALAHLRALTTPGAGGNRYLLAAGSYCNQEIADLCRGVSNAKYKVRIPVGEPGKREAHLHFAADATDAENTFGIKWTRLESCLEELVPQLFHVERQGVL